MMGLVRWLRAQLTPVTVRQAGQGWVARCWGDASWVWAHKRGNAVLSARKRRLALAEKL